MTSDGGIEHDVTVKQRNGLLSGTVNLIKDG